MTVVLLARDFGVSCVLYIYCVNYDSRVIALSKVGSIISYP